MLLAQSLVSLLINQTPTSFFFHAVVASSRPSGESAARAKRPGQRVAGPQADADDSRPVGQYGSRFCPAGRDHLPLGYVRLSPPDAQRLPTRFRAAVDSIGATVGRVGRDGRNQ